MGYDTYLSGQIYIQPPLTDDEFDEFMAAVEQDFPYTNLSLTTDSIEANDSMRGDIEEHLNGVLALLPEGHNLNGDIYWDGEDSEDKGVFRVRRGRLVAHTVLMEWPGGPDFDPTAIVAPARAAWR